MRSFPHLALLALLTLASGLGALGLRSDPAQDSRAEAPGGAGSQGCLVCHAGIEDMHPKARLSCVDCHGGDATAAEKERAHAPAPRDLPPDERVAEERRDLAWRRFKNPMDLRVAKQVCGGCHASEVERVHTSLHGTTAGHLSDGYYEVGLLPDRRSAYGVFPVAPGSARSSDIDRLAQLPPFDERGPADRLSTHYSDLPRKECMQCHLWSQGRAVRGRVGFDGDYRGEGCAACHVTYARDGLSRSADRSAQSGQPGRPLRHEMTRAPSTETCTSCHYGDASIGLSFRGLSQLPPGAPGGPDIPGTTDALLNRVFYLDDPSICPPDVHHERGMHCIDCHTANDVMGDGVLYGKMEDAVEIGCAACHGSFTRASTLRTERGTPLAHLRREGDRVILRGKVTGREHVVPQIVHVLDPTRPEYNERAARAMTPEHEKLACYTCHAAWNVNFLGFHFDRNASLSQLDLVSGARTPGRVTTQEKGFATWKSFYAGFDSHGAIAPYMTGFSTMGSVTDERGRRILDQVMPVTAAGLSGLSMIHHQTHTVRAAARSCVECHRSPATFGLGSINFRLARQLAFVADRRGVEVVAVDREQLARSAPLAKVVLPGVVALEILADPLQGFARQLFAAEEEHGIHVIDVADPTRPRRTGFVASVAARGLALSGDHLYCADGPAGLVVYDVRNPARPERVGAASTFDARAVHVQWPYAYVADGPGGLAILDVRLPSTPKLLAAIAMASADGAADHALDVLVLFQYSRPVPGEEEREEQRTRARNLCVVLAQRQGPVLVDVTEPTRPEILRLAPGSRFLRTAEEWSYRDLALASQVELAEPQGGARTGERDYAYLLRERQPRQGAPISQLVVVDLSDPLRPRQVGTTLLGNATQAVELASFYNTPFLAPVILSPGELGTYATDVRLAKAPTSLGALPGLVGSRAIAVERFPLDAMRDPAGRALKDVSHEGARWLSIEEIERVLSVPAARLGLVREGAPPPALHGEPARTLLRELDRDRTGFLEAEESGALAKEADADRDGRVSLAELARYGGLLAEPTERTRREASPADSAEGASRESELARLLDGIDPALFDRDGNRKLDRGEATRAFFAALDLDGDGNLSRDELSRHPGELRDLRFPGPAVERLFAGLDSNRDGRIALREFRLREGEWRALDADGDGSVSLGAGAEPAGRRGAIRSEWPHRRAEPLPLPPSLDAAGLARLDRDGDGQLSGRELRQRRDLLRALDLDGDGIVGATEMQAGLARLVRDGVEACADDFAARWDLDGDGRVDEQELALPAYLRARVLRAR